MCLLRGYVLYEKYIRVHTTCQYPKKDSSPYRRGQAFNTCRAARQSRLLQPLLSLFKFHRHIDAQREAYTQKTNRSRTPGQPGRLLSDGGGTRLHAATKLRVNTRSRVHSCAIPFEKLLGSAQPLEGGEGPLSGSFARYGAGFEPVRT